MDSMTSTECKVSGKSRNTTFSSKEIMKIFLGIEDTNTYKIQNQSIEQDGSVVIVLSVKACAENVHIAANPLAKSIPPTSER